MISEISDAVAGKKIKQSSCIILKTRVKRHDGHIAHVLTRSADVTQSFCRQLNVDRNTSAKRASADSGIFPATMRGNVCTLLSLSDTGKTFFSLSALDSQKRFNKRPNKQTTG